MLNICSKFRDVGELTLLLVHGSDTFDVQNVNDFWLVYTTNGRLEMTGNALCLNLSRHFLIKCTVFAKGCQEHLPTAGGLSNCILVGVYGKGNWYVMASMCQCNCSKCFLGVLNSLCHCFIPNHALGFKHLLVPQTQFTCIQILVNP